MPEGKTSDILGIHNPETVLAESDLTESALNQGLTPRQVAAMRGAAKWGQVLSAQGKERQTMKRVFEQTGHIPGAQSENRGKVSRAFTPNQIPPEVRDAVITSIGEDPAIVEAVKNEDVEPLTKVCPKVSQSRIQLLKAMIQQEVALAELDLPAVRNGFPLPIQDFNLFHRFLLSGTETPDEALRHLRSALPFFIRSKSMLESFLNPKFSHLNLKFTDVALKFKEPEKPKEEKDSQKKDDDEKDSKDKDGKDKKEKATDEEKAQDKKDRAATECIYEDVEVTENTGDFLKILRAMLAQVDEMGFELNGYSGVEVLDLPHFPSFSIRAIKHQDRRRLGYELWNWLLTGEANGELLNQRRLTATDEAWYERRKKMLPVWEKRLKEVMESLAKAKTTNGKARSTHRRAKLEWEVKEEEIKVTIAAESAANQKTKQEAIENNQPVPVIKKTKLKKASEQEAFERAESRLGNTSRKVEKLISERDRIKENIRYATNDNKSDDEERRKQKSIIEELLSDADALKEIKAFRQKFKAARGDKKMIALYAFHLGNAPLLPYFETAMRAGSTSVVGADEERVTLEGLEGLAHTRLILNDKGADNVKESRIGSYNRRRSKQQTLVKDFPFAVGEMNPSVALITRDVVSDTLTPELKELIDFLLTNFPMPGIKDRREFLYAVRRRCDGRRVKAEDYLQYAFESLSYIPGGETSPEEKLTSLLIILRRLGVDKMPQACTDILTRRFHISPMLINQFEVFNQNYRPRTIGEMPSIFEDYATLTGYQGSHLDALGMETELQDLEQLLVNRKVVTLVDSTEYHPELVKNYFGKEKVKSDEEKTDEIWGNYVRPSERLLRAFRLRLSEGRIAAPLQNASFVKVRNPKGIDKAIEKIVKNFYGEDLEWTPNLTTINQLLSELTLYDGESILVIEAENIKSLESYRKLIALVEEYGLRIILRVREPLPGVPQVNITPFIESEIPERLLADSDSLCQRLDLEEPPSDDLLKFTTTQVRSLRRPAEDPLNLTLQVLSGAAQNARMSGYSSLAEQDITTSIPPIFGLPDARMTHDRLKALDSFLEEAPDRVLGQAPAIAKVGNLVKQHLLNLRDNTRPLNLLACGPTGVGKTEIAVELSLSLNLPFYPIEGSQFTEKNSINRLIGSPSGYVGPDKGPLFEFAEQNRSGVVFIDETEKMHPDVQQALMNFYDKGVLTAGDGQMVSRPGLIIMQASNAGANELRRGQDDSKILKILGERFKGPDGVARPEIPARAIPILMLAIEKAEFMKVVEGSLAKLGRRFGFIQNNLRFGGMDEAAVDALYKGTLSASTYDEAAIMKELGESAGNVGFMSTSKVSDIAGDRFYNLRSINRALDEIVGPSLQKVVEDQIRSGRYALRDNPTYVKFVGNGDMVNVERIER